jgi:hypothetical protein
MARYKRYFPVSHEINHDPEMMQFKEDHGLPGFSLWLEILALLDRHENQLLVTEKWLATISKLVGCRFATGLLALNKWVTNGWLIPSQPFAKGLQITYSSPKYGEYHRTGGRNNHENIKIGEPPKLLTLSEPIKRDDVAGAPRPRSAPLKSSTDGVTLEHKIEALLNESPWRNEHDEPAFEQLWQAWPKKEHYLQAKLAWLELRPTSSDWEILLAQIEKRERSGGEWEGNNRRYCPQLANYLREKRWKDGV